MAVSPVLSHPFHHRHRRRPRLSQPLTVKKTKSISMGSRLELEQAMHSLDRYSAKGKAPGDHQAYYSSLISLCIANKALQEGNRLRSHLARTGYEPGLFLENQFINLYARCGEVKTARELFDAMRDRNVVSWNAMIAGYCSNCYFLDAIALFQAMVETGPKPDQPTYLSALRATAGSRNIKHGEQIHACLIKEGLISRIELGNALISMYSKLGRPENAEVMYRSMDERDEVSWNSLIAANAQTAGGGQRALALFVEMLEEGLIPDEFTFGSLLGSEEVVTAEELHSQIIRRGLGGNVFTGSALADAYARCGNLQDMLQVFHTMSQRNTVSWNSAIAACFNNGMAGEGHWLLLQMGENGMHPDEYTISILLKAATGQLSATSGKQFHALSVKMGSHTNTLMGNSLIAMYTGQEAAAESWQAFQDVIEPDLITWNSMIQSSVRNKRFEQALDLFVEMTSLGFQPDEYSFVGALAACASLGWLGTGGGIHCHLIKTGLTPDTFVGGALIDMYAKSTALTDAKQVFDKIKGKDLITWNTMIAGFAQNGNLDEVLKLLCLMRVEHLKPDNFTFASALAASANATAMQCGRQVHALVLKSEGNPDAAVSNALITMYIKSGSIEEAEKVFSELEDKNVVSWTVMIGGYTQTGHSREALQLFDKMESCEVTPNGKTFIALLTACSYAGLTEESSKYFNMMEARYGIEPGFDHYACMVDILGRTGRLNEAEDLIEGMPYEPDALMWRILLSACRIHGDQDRGRRAMERIVALHPGDSAAYVLLSNLYASMGNWDGVEEVRQLMRANGVMKVPAKSSIEVHNRLHEFMAGDHSHPQTDEICSKLRELFKQMKDEGYDPCIEYPGEIIQ